MTNDSISVKECAMKSKQPQSQNIDEYISRFPQHVQVILEKIRTAIRKAAPSAQEAMKYGIPTFTLYGNLVHFGAHKNHIGFYPTPKAIAEFKSELSSYEGAKGTVRFPLDKPIPYALIRRIVEFRVKMSEEKQKRRD